MRIERRIDILMINVLFDDSSRSRILLSVVSRIVNSIFCSSSWGKSMRSKYRHWSSFECRSNRFVDKNFKKNLFVNRRVFSCFSFAKNSFERWRVDVKIWKSVSRFLTYFASFQILSTSLMTASTRSRWICFKVETISFFFLWRRVL